MRVLITNDDGAGAPGLAALVEATHAWTQRAPSGHPREIVVVAPDRNYSGAGASVGEVYSRSSIAYRRHRFEGLEDVECYALDASPALCVLIGILGGIGPRPDSPGLGLGLPLIVALTESVLLGRDEDERTEVRMTFPLSTAST